MPSNPADDHPIRGVWIWNTARLLQDAEQIDRLVNTAKDAGLTDAYLHVKPDWYRSKRAAITSFNIRLHSAGLRIWALDGDSEYVADQEGNEPLMQGLNNFVDYNDLSEPAARFHGFQLHLEPHDTADDEDGFHNDVPQSELNMMQATERDMRMHMWLNSLTRASAFVHSYDMPFAAVMPYWLHEYNGEPVTVSWASPGSSRTCAMEIVMPMLDQYIVMSLHSDPARTASRTMAQARFASNGISRGEHMPRVLASVAVSKDLGREVLHADRPSRQNRATVLDDVAKIQRVLSKYPAFGGIAIRDWEGFEKLPE